MGNVKITNKRHQQTHFSGVMMNYQPKQCTIKRGNPLKLTIHLHCLIRPHMGNLTTRAFFHSKKKTSTKRPQTSPDQWHRQKVDNVFQVIGHNSWIHRCSLARSFLFLNGQGWLGWFGWFWLVGGLILKKNTHGVSRQDFTSFFVLGGTLSFFSSRNIRKSTFCLGEYSF